MDLTDFAILRELSHPGTFQWDVRVSYAEVGRRLGLDEETVRGRIKRMQEAGLITGWSVLVNPRVLGRTMVHAVLALPRAEDKERAIAALQAMDGVVVVFERYGPSLGVVLMQEPGRPLERHLALLAATIGPPDPVSPITFPPPTATLDRTDWGIVAALRRDPRRSYVDLAGELGLSERTLRRRVEALTAGRAVYLSARVDLPRAEGLVPASFHVVHRDPARRGAVDDHLRSLEGLVFQWFEGAASRVSLARRNVAEVEALRKELAALPGVERVLAEITLRRIDVDGWLDDLVAAKAQGKAP